MGTMAKAIFLFGIAFLFCINNVTEASRDLLQSGPVELFDVTKFYRKPTEEEVEYDEDYIPGSYYDAFAAVWDAACRNSTGSVKILVPKGTFLLTPIIFSGPCKCAKPIVFEVAGTIVSPTNPSLFPNAQWIEFSDIDGLVLNGNGVFDGQGGVVDNETHVSAWATNDCRKNKNCVPPSSNLRFGKVHNSIVTGITSLNSKWFHLHVFSCNNFTATDIRITAPGDSPNTDGIHFSQCNLVNVANSNIATGDDCISIGQGCINTNIHNITCGPGHGISIGSLGKERDDKSVEGVTVTDCTFTNTTNGARIKTWIGQSPGEVKKIVYENLVMNNVKNPIVIDQSYGSKTVRGPSNSLWKITDAHFRKIKGTTVSNVAVSLQCSSKNPCEGVEVADVDLVYNGDPKNKTLASSCNNAKAKFAGKLSPGACL
ncbi:hypothetical protein L6164_032712 [Bauhinia variegata]|uniref:Uncharacterized protein n=1 Tax=Bauhinia variegata TaxID=167791 RepID=A0ACB9KPP2_BAUVA|nr:hypothetical protein L6164_032712 [Bauhinia variegata]